MWLPAPFYERLPHFWLMVGVLLMVSAVYFGFGYKWSSYYFAGGVISCVWSISIIVLRTRRKASAGSDQEASDASDQT